MALDISDEFRAYRREPRSMLCLLASAGLIRKKENDGSNPTKRRHFLSIMQQQTPMTLLPAISLVLRPVVRPSSPSSQGRCMASAGIEQAESEEAADDVGKGVDVVKPSAANDKGGEREDVEGDFEEDEAFTVRQHHHQVGR
jgi:hypothetical protein